MKLFVFCIVLGVTFCLLDMSLGCVTGFSHNDVLVYTERMLMRSLRQQRRVKTYYMTNKRKLV